MKKTQNQVKKYPPNIKKKGNGTSHIHLGKKNVSIRENNCTIFNFFKISSVHKSTSTPVVPDARQAVTNSNKNKGNSEHNCFLSKFELDKSKQEKNTIILKNITKNTEEKDNKIDVSNFILFNENFSNEINNIFTNNFIRYFKRYLEDNFKNNNIKISCTKNLNISKNTFNKFIQQNFKYFIIKYLLNTYHDLIYVPEKYMMNQNKKNDLNEVDLLMYNDKPNIYLEYLPINLIECNLFYPDLCSYITKFLKNFRQKKRKKKPNSALLLYRPNSDFTAYITKINIICNQLGYRLLIREDEVNKLMNIDKLKEINQNYIIGSLQDKNLKYLKILDNISITEKWTNFLESNNIQIIPSKEIKINKNKQYCKNQGKNKIQTTIDMTQILSNKIILEKDNKEKNDEINILSRKILTFIGHSNSNYMPTQENEKYTSKEYKIFQNYQQNILEKYNKRRNVILFVDNFEKNEENIRYINQINTIIPTSKSPIIILTNNLSMFIDNLTIGNTNLHTRYIYKQIENEGIKQKENIIYMVFLIIYFTVFFPKELSENRKEENNKINKKPNRDEKIEKNEEKELDIVIQINNSELNSSIDNWEYKNYYLEKIKNTINNIFINNKLNHYNNELYTSIITISNIISMINDYEIDNILVYLKNFFELINYKIQKLNIKQKIILLQKAVLSDIEKYEIRYYYDEDISKISDIYDNNSFLDYEYGSINNIAENKYEEKLRNFGINKGIDYNKESYFYTNEHCYNYKNSNNYNYISNNEIEERIIEDHKFFQNYYNFTNTILNHSVISKLNMILCQIIINERISIEDTSRFIGTRYSKRNNNYHHQHNFNLNNNNLIMNEKISLLNKLFRKCPLESFTRYINAHIGYNYYTEFIMDDKKYFIPDKLLFYNYYNDYYLMEQIQSEHMNKYNENEEEEDDFGNNDLSEDEDYEEYEEI